MCCERTLYNLQGVYVNRIIYAFWLRMQAGLEKNPCFFYKKTSAVGFMVFFWLFLGVFWGFFGWFCPENRVLGFSLLLICSLVGFGRACAPVRCAHPSFWAHCYAKQGAHTHRQSTLGKYMVKIKNLFEREKFVLFSKKIKNKIKITKLMGF